MHTQDMPHSMIVNRLDSNKERFRHEGFNQIRRHSIRSVQFDQKVRPLSFRQEKIDLFTATPLNLLSMLDPRGLYRTDSKRADGVTMIPSRSPFPLDLCDVEGESA